MMPRSVVLTAALITGALLSSGLAVGQTATKRQKPAQNKGRKQLTPQQSIDFGSMEVGQSGFLTFATARTTLMPLKAGNIDDGQFLGLLSSGKGAAIVRGVKTEGMVSGRWYQLAGPVTVAGTEELSDGSTVFVLEPTDPSTFTINRSDSPDLVRPR